MNIDDKIRAGEITLAELRALPTTRREQLLLSELNNGQGKHYVRPQTLTELFDDVCVAIEERLA